MSNITGAPLGEEGMKPDYWRRHLREAVRFSDLIAHLQSDGYRLFLEVGPSPILSGMAQRCAGAADSAYVSSLRRGRDDRRSMLEAAARLYVAGARLHWPAITGEPSQHTPLPTYPFQRTRFWLEDKSKEGSISFNGKPTGHPLLGVRVSTPLEIYATAIGVSIQTWAQDHRIFGHTPFPAAGFLELALAAATRRKGSTRLGKRNYRRGLAATRDGRSPSRRGHKRRDRAEADRAGLFSAAAGDAEEPPVAPSYNGADRYALTDPQSSVCRRTPKDSGWSLSEAYYSASEAVGADTVPCSAASDDAAQRTATCSPKSHCPPGFSAPATCFIPLCSMRASILSASGWRSEDAVGTSTDLLHADRAQVASPSAATVRTASDGRVTVAPRNDRRPIAAAADIAMFDAVRRSSLKDRF